MENLLNSQGVISLEFHTEYNNKDFYIFMPTWMKGLSKTFSIRCSLAEITKPNRLQFSKQIFKSIIEGLFLFSAWNQSRSASLILDCTLFPAPTTPLPSPLLKSAVSGIEISCNWHLVALPQKTLCGFLDFWNLIHRSWRDRDKLK